MRSSWGEHVGADWRARALEAIEPTPEENEHVQAQARELEDAVAAFLEEQGWEGQPRVEGSLAKQTYLAGQADMDCFVAFARTVDRAELEKRARSMGQLLDDAVVAYAEHPYVQGTWQDHDAEIVPCYDVDDASQLQSAVDRTRLHTTYVNEHLDEAGCQEVRLLKAFLRGAEIYGAEESVLGFSGYLAELLVLAFGDLEGVLAWALAGFEHPVEPGDPGQAHFEDALIVVDPVDPTRNAAAAVAPSSLIRLREAAGAFTRAPSAGFLEDPPPARLEGEQASRRCRARATRPLAIRIATPEAELEDPVHAQLRRALTLTVEEIERKQVPIAASAVHVQTDEHGRPSVGWLLIEAEENSLQQPLLHEGPPVHVDEHADSFRQAWEDNDRAAGPIFEDEGRLFVRVERQAVSLHGIAEPHLREAKAGKVVDEAIREGSIQTIEGTEAIGQVPADALGRLLDRRRPWERRA